MKSLFITLKLYNFMFRSRRGFEEENEEEEMEKRSGNHGYLLRTRKSEEPEPTTRNTRGSYLFRTRKSDPNEPNIVPERDSRGAGYLFRTRKSAEENDSANFQHQMMNRYKMNKIRKWQSSCRHGRFPFIFRS